MNMSEFKNHVEALFRARLPECFTYHNWEHTLAVYGAVREFAAYSGIVGDRLTELEAAALLHDTGYFSGRVEGHEKCSSEFAARLLPEFGMTAAATERVRRLIEATVFPCHPRTPWEEILCDADIEYLGRDCYEENAGKFRRELANIGREFSEEEWRDFQDGFLSRITFFSSAGRALRLPGLERLRQARGISFIPGGFHA